MKKYRVEIEGTYSGVTGEMLDERATVEEFDSFEAAVERYGEVLVSCTRASYAKVNGWKATDGFVKILQIGETYVMEVVCTDFTCSISGACPCFGSY